MKAVSRTILLEACKYSALRAVSPTLRTIYQTLDSSAVTQPFLGGAPSRVLKRAVRRMVWYRNPPKKFFGGLILNALGFQIWRVRVINRRMRHVTPSNRASTSLRERGFEVLPKLLNPSAVDRLRQEYCSNLVFRSTYLRDFDELILYSPSELVHNPNENVTEVKLLLDLVTRVVNYRSIYERVVGTPLRSEPFISIIRHRYVDDSPSISNLDGNNVPHTDVFFPSHKLFVYLSDVGQFDAPLTYWPGTHVWSAKTSAWSLWRESVSYYLSRWMGTKPSTPAPPKSQPQPLLGRAGDAIFFDVSGVHRRGDHYPGSSEERLVLLFDFRDASARFPSPVKM